MSDTQGPCHSITFEHDPDPDLSWLDQDCYNPSHPSYEPTFRDKESMDAGGPAIDGEWYRDKDNHVALAAIARDEDGNVLDSLWGIDFLVDSDDWRTGTFYHINRIPAGYLRDIARDMGLPE